MATYYRWEKSQITYTETSRTEYPSITFNYGDRGYQENRTGWYYASPKPVLDTSTGMYTMRDHTNGAGKSGVYMSCDEVTPIILIGSVDGSTVYVDQEGNSKTFTARRSYETSEIIPLLVYESVRSKGEFVEYVYSTSSTAYPNGGVQGDYYYDQRTTVTSPTAPGSISYPTSTTSASIQVSWGEADSETDYPVDHYELQRQINNRGWSSVNSDISGTSYTASLTSATTSYCFRVRAVDTNGKASNWKTGSTGTKINAPGAPSVSAPSTAVSGDSITVTWGSVSGATSYTVQRNTGGSWMQVYSGKARTFSETVGVWNSLQYRVQAVNQAGGGSWGYSRAITVYTSPTLTVPQQVMQGQSVPVNWTAISGASSYTLQRKANTDAAWVQVYSGGNTTFSETAGTWTSVQYRVQAVFSGTAGGWATSASIPVISASALVISGSDGDLGTVVNDIPYTISTDTGNQITATISVNSAVIFSGNVGTGTADSIPVLDLVNGTGTIVIEASVQATSGTVSAVRTWTYTKAEITFPNAGSVAQLTQQGANIWPKTLAECVRLPGGRTLEEVMGFPCQVYVGRYTGTGTYGSGNPNEVTVPFKPQAVFVSSGSVGTTIPMIRPCTSAKNGSATLTVTWEDDGVSWYSTSAANQLNAAGTTYDIVAFG